MFKILYYNLHINLFVLKFNTDNIYVFINNKIF
jgi:hypothetical protein